MTASDRPTAEAALRRRADRSTGRVLLAAVLALAVSAAAVLVFADDARWLRLGVVAALWAALVGAFAAARYRREIAGHTDRTDELRRVYELELEREVAARREYELEVESTTRRRIEEEVRNEVRDELDGLRGELRTLRQNLEALLGGEVLVERVALRAESTRLRSLSDQSRAARSAERALPQGRGDSDQRPDWTPDAGRTFAADGAVLSSRVERPESSWPANGVANGKSANGAPANGTPSNGTSSNRTPRRPADDRTDVFPKYRPRTERLTPDPGIAEPTGVEPARQLHDQDRPAARYEGPRYEPVRQDPQRHEAHGPDVTRQDLSRQYRQRQRPDSRQPDSRQPDSRQPDSRQPGGRREPANQPPATPPSRPATPSGTRPATPSWASSVGPDSARPTGGSTRPDPLGVDASWATEPPAREPVRREPLDQLLDGRWRSDPQPTPTPTPTPAPAWEGVGSWTPTVEAGPADRASGNGGRRRRAEEPAPPEYKGGRRRAPESEPPASSGSPGGRRRAAEPTGSHAAGRSVDDLLASLGDGGERRHRRRD